MLIYNMFLKKYPSENIKKEFDSFLNGDDPYSRDNAIGHITGSCWIVSRDGKKVLLTLHKKLKIWIPCGGHSEGETDPLKIALREGKEESGLDLEPYSNQPFYMDIHIIPEHKGVKKHKHFDYTYLLFPKDSHKFILSNESIDLKWVDLNNIKNFSDQNNVKYMAFKTLELKLKAI